MLDFHVMVAFTLWGEGFFSSPRVITRGYKQAGSWRSRLSRMIYYIPGVETPRYKHGAPTEPIVASDSAIQLIYATFPQVFQFAPLISVILPHACSTYTEH